MTQQIVFTELKQTVSIERAAEFLGLRLKRVGEQLRGPCPICKDGNDRALAITPSRGLFYCFGKCHKGGDMITLAAGARNCSLGEAAQFLATKAGQVEPAPTTPSSAPQPTSSEGKFRPLDYLQFEHEAVQGLGISPKTATHFGSGYAPKGIMRGRLALPLHDETGALVGYCGRAVKDEEPFLIFPNRFDSRGVIFNSQRVTSRQLFLVRDPLEVLLAFESGFENVIAFVSDGITVGQLEQLGHLMLSHKSESVEFF